MKESKRYFMVSYMESGKRRKFIVKANRKSEAIDRAELLGAKPLIRKAVQELNKDSNT